jgi:hypothetical protein
MGNWFRVAFEHAVTHCVHSSLLAPLIVDMAERGHPVENFQVKYGVDHARSLRGNPAPIDKWGFDLGGMCYATMPRETFEISGLPFVVDCDYFDAILSDVKTASLRWFASGEPYYKLKFWHHATVLTPEQHARCVHSMSGLAASAKERAEAFFARKEAANA